MWIVLGIIAAGLGVSTGIAVGKVVEKALGQTSTLFGLLPTPQNTDGLLTPPIHDPVTGKLSLFKIIALAIFSAIGILIVKFVGKKMNIKFLK